MDYLDLVFTKLTLYLKGMILFLIFTWLLALTLDPEAVGRQLQRLDDARYQYLEQDNTEELP